MTAREMSADTYHSADFAMTADQSRKAIETFMRNRKTPVTRRQIADLTGIEYSSVSGRINELMATRRVYETGQYVVNRSGRQAALLLRRDHMPMQTELSV